MSIVVGITHDERTRPPATVPAVIHESAPTGRVAPATVIP